MADIKSDSSGFTKFIPLLKKLGPMILILGIVATIISSCMGGRGISGFSGYSKTFEIEVATLEPHRLCGIPTGEHTFNIPKGREVEVFIGRDKYDITSTLRVNKTFPGEKFEVERDECVSVSFSVNESFQKNKFARQIVAITFH